MIRETTKGHKFSAVLVSYPDGKRTERTIEVRGYAAEDAQEAARRQCRDGESARSVKMVLAKKG